MVSSRRTAAGRFSCLGDGVTLEVSIQRSRSPEFGHSDPLTSLHNGDDRHQAKRYSVSQVDGCVVLEDAVSEPRGDADSEHCKVEPVEVSRFAGARRLDQLGQPAHGCQDRGDGADHVGDLVTEHRDSHDADQGHAGDDQGVLDEPLSLAITN